MPALLAKLGSWVANVLLLPLLQKGLEAAAKAIMDWWKRRTWIKKKTSDTDTRVENYENSTDRDSARDTFGKLP